MIDRRTAIGAGLGLALVGRAGAQSPVPPPPIAWPPAEHFTLWPGRPPGAPTPLPSPSAERNGYQGAELWLRGIAEPIVGVYCPARPDGRAVLAIPGGGYEFVSVSNEGIDVARALNRAGITVFVLAYRLPGGGWANSADVPLQDAQRAMRLIRARAQRWGIDPARLGVIGFSAGGNTAGALATAWRAPVYAPVDAADRIDARPGFAGLIYPVLSWSAEPKWLAEPPTPETESYRRYDAVQRATAEMPRLFLAQAADDPLVPPHQSLLMFEKARALNVPAELHLFASGGHGFGAFHLPPGAPGLLWPELFARWIG